MLLLVVKSIVIVVLLLRVTRHAVAITTTTTSSGRFELLQTSNVVVACRHHSSLLKLPAASFWAWFETSSSFVVVTPCHSSLPQLRIEFTILKIVDCWMVFVLLVLLSWNGSTFSCPFRHNNISSANLPPRHVLPDVAPRMKTHHTSSTAPMEIAWPFLPLSKSALPPSSMNGILTLTYAAWSGSFWTNT